MNFLAIDTSTDNLVIAASVNGATAYVLDSTCKMRHSETLLNAVEETLEKLSATVRDIDVFACTVGPGSFTGIRIAVATVKGFCAALSKPYIAVTSFDTLAYAVRGGARLAVIDAKHGHYYAAGYDDGNNNVIFEPQFIDAETLTKLSLDYKLLSLGEIEGYTTTLCDISVGLKNAVESKLELAIDDIETLLPLYLRQSQAEEGRK